MATYYGRVSLEKLNIGSKSERWAYMLSADNGSMYELRPKNAPPFFNPDNSPFKTFRGLDVVVEAQPWNANVIIVSTIKKRFP